MFLSKVKAKPLAVRSFSSAWFPSEHLLFSLTGGSGRFRGQWYPQSGKDVQVPFALMLGDVPLLLVQSSGCPTCESLLAAGYGLPPSQELREATDRLSAPYTGLQDSLERLTPVLGLLPPSVYVLSHCLCSPTDGTGNFFWDIPGGFTSMHATAQIYDSDNFRVLPSFPCFLYPSQPGTKHDPERVEYYREMIRRGEPLPPALAYFEGGYLCLLLDGHHRACACALEKTPLPCLVLSVPGRFWRDGKLHIWWPDNWWPGQKEASETIFLSPEERNTLLKTTFSVRRDGPPPVPVPFPTKEWPSEYQAGATAFPTFREAAALALYPLRELTVDGVEKLLHNEEKWDEAETLVALLQYFARQPGGNIKKMALSLAGICYPLPLRLAAFQILNKIKKDKEIEDFFVDFLVNCDDRTNPLRHIADHYWD
jgi:hypothetical protein